MPLELLGPLVFVGIVLVIVIVRLYANTPPRLIQTPEQALDIFLQDFPSVAIGSRIFVTADKFAAILLPDEPAHTLGLVTVLGSKHVTRLLEARDIIALADAGEGACQLKLNDFTFPKIALRFSRATIIDTLSDHVTAMKLTGDASPIPSTGTLS